MRFGMFLFLFLAVTAAATSEPKPFVVKQSACLKDMGGGDCETIVIENPLMKPVLVEITCGPEYDRSELKIPARTRQSIDIEVTTAGKDAVCKLASWKTID